MLSDRVSNPGPLTYESGAPPTALRGPANMAIRKGISPPIKTPKHLNQSCIILESNVVFPSKQPKHLDPISDGSRLAGKFPVF